MFRKSIGNLTDYIYNLLFATPIRNAQQLKQIDGKSGLYYLDANIDLSSEDSIPVRDFEGILDGKGYEIRNLELDLDSEFCGLIGFNSGTIKNLTIRNFKISKGGYVGCIAGQSGIGSEISNCTVIDSQVSSGYSVGGITGGCEVSTISNCEVRNTEIIDGDICGSITGLSEKSKILECRTEEARIEESSFAGGIVGNNKGSYLRGSNILNSTLKRAKCIGGLVGVCEKKSQIISGKVESTKIKGELKEGGIVGHFNGIDSPRTNRRFGSPILNEDTTFELKENEQKVTQKIES